jgi:hypothetical protein
MTDAEFETQLSQAFHAPLDRPDDAVADHALTRLDRLERRRRLVLAAAALTGLSLTGAGIAAAQATAAGAAFAVAAKLEPLLHHAASPWALLALGLAVTLLAGVRFMTQES